MHRFNVLLLGDEAYKSCLASIMTRIGEHGMIIEHGRRIDASRDKRLMRSVRRLRVR